MNLLSQIKPEKRPYLLKPTIQNYIWGPKDKKSYIPDLLGIEPEPDMHYAELWMGAHKKAPAQIETHDESIALNRWIEEYPDAILGASVQQKFNARLPFLLKILSAAEPLSIQAHPNKIQAEKLYLNTPEHYPDMNHKPEIAVVLDHLTALVGLKTGEDLKNTLHHYTEIAGFWGPDLINHIFQTKNEKLLRTLRNLYIKFIQKSIQYPVDLKRSTDSLAERLKNQGQLSKEDILFLSMYKKYNGSDIGPFFIYLMNWIELETGQGLFIHAGVPHAYIRGNIVECMANSDNVVRAGLTHKFKDIEALANILIVEKNPYILYETKSEKMTRYNPPIQDFELIRYQFNAGDTQKIKTKGIEILLVIHGNIQLSYKNAKDTIQLQKGESWLIPGILGGYTLKIENETLLYRAVVP